MCSCVLVGGLVFLANSHQLTSQAGAVEAGHEQVRDGQHDFDFLFGTWKFHLKRRVNPLSGSNDWIEFDGTAVSQKVWDAAPMKM
jgi:hypothetical protein